MEPNKIIIIILLAVVLILITKKKKGVKLIKVRSDIDSKFYIVRDEETKQRASNMLGRIRKNILTLTNYLVQNRDSKYKHMAPYIDQLSSRIKSVKISESDGSSKYTSYSVNKGEELVFCLRSKKGINIMHELNLVMYVALHEIAHIACPEFGHTPLFKKIFTFFTKISAKIGVYKIIPFGYDSREYCGLIISDSVV